MRIITKALCLMYACFCLTATAQKKLTIDECIEIALKNNLDIRKQNLDKRSKEIYYKQSKYDLLPSINATVGHRYDYGLSTVKDNTNINANSSSSNFNVSGNITLFDGLQMKYNVKARQAELMASEADLETVKEQIVINVNMAFMQVLLNKELLRIRVSQLESTKQNIKQREELVKNGKIAEGELLELNAQLAKEEMDMIQGRNSLELSLLTLTQILELDDVIDIETVPVEEMLGQEELLNSKMIYTEALNHRPEILAMQFRQKAGDAELKIAKSKYMPTLTLGANIGTGYYNVKDYNNESFNKQFRDNMRSSIGFNLSIPIFNRLQIRSGVRLAQLAIENIRIEADRKKLELRKKIEEASQNAIAAKSRWDAAIKSHAAVENAYRYAKEKYNNGRANSYELFLAKNNFAQSQADQTQAKYEYLFRIKVLMLLKD